MTVENVVSIVVMLMTLACIGNIWVHWITVEAFIGALCGCTCAILLGILTHALGTGICLVAMIAGAIGGGYLWRLVPETIKKVLKAIIIGAFVVILVAAILNLSSIF